MFKKFTRPGTMLSFARHACGAALLITTDTQSPAGVWF